MKKFLVYSLVILLVPIITCAQNIFEGIGWVNFGSVIPKGDYSSVLKSGTDLEVTGIRTFGTNVGAGIGFHYSELPIKSANYKGNYSILFSKTYIAVGSFDPSSKIIYAGLFGLGMHFSSAPEPKIYNYYPTTNEKAIETGFWLGLEIGGVVGYRFSNAFGISIKSQYDLITKFVESAKYFSIKGGLLITLN